MAVDETNRLSLRESLAGYMRGEILTFEFDDANSNFKRSEDAGLAHIANWLYLIHDDTVDHKVSVSHSTWQHLNRILAFLTTAESVYTDENSPYWPFANREDWLERESSNADLEIPRYEKQKHGIAVHGFPSQIPTTVGVTILVTVVILSFWFIVWFG